MGVVGLLGAVRVGRWWMNVFQGRTKIAPNREWHDAQPSPGKLSNIIISYWQWMKPLPPPGYISGLIYDRAQLPVRIKHRVYPARRRLCAGEGEGVSPRTGSLFSHFNDPPYACNSDALFRPRTSGRTQVLAFKHQSVQINLYK